MKRGLIVGLFLVLLIISLSIYVSAQDISVQNECKRLGYECGNLVDSEGEKLDCGSCDTGYVCITGNLDIDNDGFGQCYDINDIGKCISDNEKNTGEEFICENIRFPKNPEDYEYYREICAKNGCEWDESNPNPESCIGTPMLCSSLEPEECLTGLDSRCDWENSRIYATTHSWRGEGVFRTRKGELGATSRLVLYINESILKNFEDIEIPLFMTLENSRLPEGTEVMFEIYGYGREKEVSKGEQVLKVPNEVILSSLTGIIDEKGSAVVSWVLTEEILAKINYKDRSVLRFRVKKDGKILYTPGGLVEEDPLLLITKTGECSGIISCNLFYKKWNCEEVSRNYDCGWVGNSCEGSGVPCGIIGNREECANYGCSWKWDSFWVMFRSWLVKIFT